MTDVPGEYIVKAIAANEALVPALEAKLRWFERIKEKLIEETNVIFEKAIQSLGKSEFEESKEPTLPS